MWVLTFLCEFWLLVYCKLPAYALKLSGCYLFALGRVWEQEAQFGIGLFLLSVTSVRGAVEGRVSISSALGKL